MSALGDRDISPLGSVPITAVNQAKTGSWTCPVQMSKQYAKGSAARTVSPPAFSPGCGMSGWLGKREVTHVEGRAEVSWVWG